MFIKEAIATASNQHVVEFLLAAYVETLHRYEQTRSVLPRDVARLPIAGPADIATRVAALRESIAIEERVRFQVRPVLREACGVFSTALRRLRTIAPAPAAPNA